MGGSFKHSQPAKYLGGELTVLDFVNIDRLKCNRLKRYGGLRVKGELRFFVILNGGFKIVIDDADLKSIAKKHLKSRVLHVYSEKINNQEDCNSVVVEEEGDGQDVDGGEEWIEEPEFRIGDEVSDDDRLNGRQKHDEHAYIEPAAAVEQEETSEEEEDVIGTGLDDFDEARVSDEDSEKPVYPVFNPKTTFHPTFVLQQVFGSKQEFRKAVQSHAILSRRNLRTVKNDKFRVHVVCNKSTNCGFRMRCLKMVGQESWQLREYQPKHDCAPSYNVKNVKSTWLSERYVQRFQSDANRWVPGFRDDVVNELNCHVSKQQAYRAKYSALKLIQGEPDEQYTRLWSYRDELRKTNPGNTVILGVDNAGRFSRFYVCFDALKKGFLGGCRPIIGIDGCFSKGVHGGQLLSAVGVDPNNNLYPIAYAIVATENGETWEWFLTVLKQDLLITNPTEFSFISDKQKGLVAALASVYPGSEHRFCVRHLHNNLKTSGWTGVAFKNFLWGAAQATTPGEFRVRMRQMRDYNLGAWEWFRDKPPNQWSKAFFRTTPKCDILLNNACESFNSCILDARDKPIITMLEWIRIWLMTRLQKNRDRAMLNWKKKLCPKIEKIIESYSEKIADYRPLKCNNQNYQVSSADGTQYTVNLEKWSCSCRSWELTGIPCRHAICAILSQDKLPEDFTDPYYFVDTYLKVYEPTIMGISYEALWGDSMYIPPLPPDFGKKKRGRPAKARRRENGEPKKGGSRSQVDHQEPPPVRMKRQQKTLLCRKCGGVGHNSKSSKCPLNNQDDADLDENQSGGDREKDDDVNRADVDTEGPSTRPTKRQARRPKKVPRTDDPIVVLPPMNNQDRTDEPTESQNEQVQNEQLPLETDFVYDIVERQLLPGPTMFEQLQSSYNAEGTSTNRVFVTSQQLEIMRPRNKASKTQPKTKGKGKLVEDNRQGGPTNEQEPTHTHLGQESYEEPIIPTQPNETTCEDHPLPSQHSQVIYDYPPLPTQPTQHSQVPIPVPLQPSPRRAHIRAPAPWTGGVLPTNFVPTTTFQKETSYSKKIIFSRGRKFLDLSNQN